MKNVSTEFKKIEKSGGPFYAYAKCTLLDGTELNFDSYSDFYAEGNSFSESGGGGFPLGVALSKQITITIDNHDDRYSAYDFYGAKIVLYTEADLPDGTKERILEGTFTVIDSVAPDDALEINAYDNMYMLDADFTSSLSYPVALQQLWNELCNYYDLGNGSPTFLNDNYVVQSRPETVTGREMAGYIAQIAVGNAYVNANGQLCIKSYDFSPFDNSPTLSGGKIGESVPDTVSGGSFGDGLAEILSGGEFGESLDYYILSDFTTAPEIATDDVTITGITTVVEDEESEEETTLIYGTDDYALQIDNPLILGNEEQAITVIGQALKGVTIRPFSGDFSPAPSLEFMDMVVVIDRKNNVYPSFVTDHTFTYLGGSSISNGTESPERNAASYSSNATKIYKKVQKDLIKQKTAWETAIGELSDQVANASGLYTTEEKQPDGSTIFYMHNKPALEESDIVWKMTAETLTVSTDGGKSWNAGITVNGEVIAKIMTTIGINFDWGVGGTLIIEDAEGNQTAYIDAETGAIRFKVKSLEISGKTVEEIAQEHAAESVSNFVDSVYTPEIAQLQAQIDGQIMTWFYDYIPTTTNYPASEWTTGTEKEQHLGDLFYVVDNEESGGQAYRWAKIGTEYKWDYVEDTATVKALADAAKAQDTADQKRRVFISTPTPPYDEGDLWMQGDDGDIMTCVNSRQSGNYVSTDWEKKNKYTDDTAVTELDQSLGQQGVFNRLTNNGKTKGLYLTEDNELYLNATYIKTGVITDNIGNNYWNLSNGEFRLSPTTTVGNQEIATKNNTISSVDVEYASGTSNTTPPETGWSTNSPEWQDDRYIWQRTVTTMADGTQNISEPTCIQGAAGVGGESTTIISNTVDYAISNSGTVPPNDWLENIPPLQPGKYLWTRTVTEYSDGESSIAYGVSYQGENGTNGTDGINGTDGTDGIGIVSSSVTYQVSNSGVTPPTGDWSESVPEMNPGQFLWTRTQFTYSDGDITTSYSVSYQGENGSQGIPGPAGEDGQTLYTWIKYADTPTSGMSDTPDGKKYLGIAYNKESPIESGDYEDYQWSDIKGEDGVPGTPGENGETLYTWIKYATSASGANMSDNPTGRDYIGIAYNKATPTESTNPSDYAWSLIQGEAGIGVSQIVEQYYLSTSSTTQTGGSWSTNQPAWEKGKYIWTRSKITWTDNSVTYTDPVLAKAINGANEAVDDLDTSLDQQEVFNRLTNNGQAQGIILQNGQLYINAEYIQSLILKVGGVNNENGTFEVYNGSGVLVGKIDKDGAKFTNGNDWLQIKNSLMTGGYGGTTDGLLDLSANYSGGKRHVVLESRTGDVILKSSGDFLVERPGTGQGTLLQSGNYQYLTDVGDVEITSSETEELRAIALGESVARDASNNPIDALALIRKDTLSKVFYEGDYFSYFSSHIITGWRFVSLSTPTTIAPGYTWDLTANASGSGIPYRTGTEYLVIPVSTGWGAVGSIDQPTSAYGQGSTNFTVTLLNNGSSAHTIGCTCLVLGLLSRDLSPLA